MYSRSHWKCTSALASLLALAATGTSAASLPGHGHFVSGTGSINKASQSVTVKQSSTTGIIDWNKFSVGKGSSVSFDNGNGATLNRVTGRNLSTIAGSLHATGSLFLMNNAGVVISGSGKVVTGGSFLASTGNASGNSLDDTDLRKQSTKASIVNRGSIVASGDVSLVGGKIRSTGTISGAQVNLNGSENVVIGGAVTARNASGNGGTIIVTSRHIDVTGKPRISASGNRGGTILIGGDIHGGAIAGDDFVNQTVKNAKTTVIGAGARIAVDGSKSTGGNIVIWSEGHTSFDGKIDAKGQTAGGFAEVSSHELLGFTGKVDLTSRHGSTGTLLLDPEDVVIEDGTTANGTLAGGTFTPTGDDSVLSTADLEAALASANVTVTTGATGHQGGNITVENSVTWASRNSLTLDAAGSIKLNGFIDADEGGSLVLTAMSGDIDIEAGTDVTDLTATAEMGNILINNTQTYAFNAVSLTASGNVSIEGAGSLGTIYDRVSIKAGGTIGESDGGKLYAGVFTGSSVGGATLTGDNIINQVNFTNSGGGNVALAGVRSITSIDVGTGNLTLSGEIRFVSGPIIAGELSGDVTGNLTGANQIAVLGTIDTTKSSGKTLTIDDTVDLTILGKINVPNLNLVVNGTITESGAGMITAAKLTGSSVGGTTLNGDNAITALGMFSNSGSGDLSLTNVGANLNVSGAVNAGTGNLNLAAAGMNITAPLIGNNVALDSSGAITSSSAGIITANTLSGTALGQVSLTANNAIATLGGFATDGNPLSIVDAAPLTISGPVSASTISLQTTGTGNSLALNGALEGTTVSLNSAGDISEASFGYIDAASLTGSAGGKAIMNGAGNAIADLGAFTTAENFALTDSTSAAALTVNGAIQSQTGSIFFTAKNSKIALDSTLKGAEVEFASAGSITEGSGGAIDATTLRGNVTGSVALNGAGNIIADIGAFTAGSFALTDAGALAVNGSVTSRGDVTLTTTAAHGNIAVDGILKGTTVDLSSAGTLSESSAGAIDATMLTVLADGSAALTSAHNAFAELDGVNSSGFNFVAQDDASLVTAGTLTAGASTIQLEVIGSGHDLTVGGTLDAGNAVLSSTGTLSVSGGATVDASSKITLESKGSGDTLTMRGKLDAATVSLISAAAIYEGSASTIDAATLTGSSRGAVKLASDKNVIADLAAFNSGTHNMTLFDDHTLTTNHTVQAGTLELETVGSGHGLAVDSELSVGTVDLISSANVTQSSSGAILASLLNVTAQTGITLTSAKNRITKVGTDKTTSGPNKITL